MAAKAGPILVTGASSGIGRAIAELLSEQGRVVFATARRASDLASLAKLPRVTPIKLDVTREDQIRTATLAVRKKKMGLYGLVNSAGIADLAPLIDASPEDLAREMEVNFYGIHRMVRACFPFLRESRGRIVNISSINGVSPVEFGGAYSASKFALEAYSDVLQQELSGLGIDVCLVEPGGFRSAIMTNMVARQGRVDVKKAAETSVRDKFLKFMSEFVGAPEDRDRIKYPDPRPVAEAVIDALFSASPKHRVMVANKEETDWVIAHALRVLAQLNDSTGHRVSPKGLLAQLKAASA
jgi:NAD(P)-dependent dehydrogenase (short-subunit alcohol dehydrogenase family)